MKEEKKLLLFKQPIIIYTLYYVGLLVTYSCAKKKNK